MAVDPPHVAPFAERDQVCRIAVADYAVDVVGVERPVPRLADRATPVQVLDRVGQLFPVVSIPVHYSIIGD